MLDLCGMPAARATGGRNTPPVQGLGDAVHRRDPLLPQLPDDRLQLGRSRHGLCCKRGSMLRDLLGRRPLLLSRGSSRFSSRYAHPGILVGPKNTPAEDRGEYEES